MKTYKTADEAEIKRAIRTAETDAERAAIAQRARDIGLDLIPENWDEDGLLKRERVLPEQRETANDMFAALDGALEDAIPDSYCWVQDWMGGTDGGYEVIYYSNGSLWAAPFEFDETGKVVIGVGAAVKVRPVTDYVERKQPTPLADWRRRKADNLKGLIERRDIPTDQMELREVQTDDGATVLRLTGYASVTEAPYEVGFYTETIKRGAFKRTLSEQPDVQLLINHEGLPLARTKSGTLTLTEDDRGLRVEADLDPDDPDVQSLARKMKRGDIDQMSFAFQATAQSWNDDYTERDIKAASIHRGDVSVVNMGANELATASIRSRQAVDALRTVGGEAFVAAWLEWRDFTLLSLEERAGKALSSATMEVLTRVLDLVASADEAVDEAQPLLAELMGVPNPDDSAADTADEPDEPDEDDAPQRSAAPLDMRARRFREEQRLRELRNRRKAA